MNPIRIASRASLGAPLLGCRGMGTGAASQRRQGGPKEQDPDTPPLTRVLPGTGGPRQYLHRMKDLQASSTGQYLPSS